MNTINEKIDLKAASCREMYMPDLMALLKSDLMKFWSWGSDKLTVDKKNQPTMFRMNVNGHHHKGYVYIFLNGMDLFDVYLTDFEDKIVKRTNEMGLYFDQLIEWIDENVERIAEYKN